ncbi:MAG: 6-phosphogluconolactonase [Candidatus Curtissbacteria bacterium]
MIDLIKVKDRDEAQVKAHDILKEIVDPLTLLALSGGRTPDYRKMIVEPADINPGAICVVDERYGEPFHEKSNELLLKNQGVKECTDDRCIEAHKILIGRDFLETGREYEKVMDDLFVRFKKRVGVMGIGADLHTAGILPFSTATKSPNYVEAQVVEDAFRERITITLKALGEFTSFVLMVLGDEKKEAVKKMLDEAENDMQKYPAIFYRKAPIKSYLITDVKI